MTGICREGVRPRIVGRVGAERNDREGGAGLRVTFMRKITIQVCWLSRKSCSLLKGKEIGAGGWGCDHWKLESKEEEESESTRGSR
jgi:hypothetical protein